MAKTIDLGKTVYELANEYPEIIDIMAGLGFAEIRNKAVRNSMGRLMTIPKGAKMKHVALTDIVKALEDNGFEVIQGGRTQLLKSYLRRLSKGEAMKSVRRDFAENFRDVDATEIMAAEQELIAEGEPVGKVKEMCDIHSALFHGHTRGERQEQAAPFLSPDAARQHDAEAEKGWIAQAQANGNKASRLIATEGHPLNTLTRENEQIERLIDEAVQKLDSGEDAGGSLQRVRALGNHYAKKGDLIYPLLLTAYNISGPHKVMWTVDDEIRAELSALCKKSDHDEAWRNRARKVLQRAREMIYKEQNILFPLCAANFSDEEWRQIKDEEREYSSAPVASASGSGETTPLSESDGRASSSPAGEGGGEASAVPFTAMLDTMPFEITFVDGDNVNRFFNDNGRPKYFKRPKMALGRDVFTCHPPKIEPMVRSIIDDFRSGKRDALPVWLEKGGHPVLVTYMAVRDRQGRYLGTMEIVQDMEFARQHFAKTGGRHNE